MIFILLTLLRRKTLNVTQCKKTIATMYIKVTEISNKTSNKPKNEYALIPSVCSKFCIFCISFGGSLELIYRTEHKVINRIITIDRKLIFAFKLPPPLRQLCLYNYIIMNNLYFVNIKFTLVYTKHLTLTS